jgi:hypothetical protein
LWERYVDSQVDYRAGSETLARKLSEAGTDSWQLLQWLDQPEQAPDAGGDKAQLLRRVFGEQFEIRAGQPAPATLEKVAVEQGELPASAGTIEAQAPKTNPAPEGIVGRAEQSHPQPTAPSASAVQPKDKKQLASDRVQNPHEPEATYAVKGRGENKKEHVGYKVQVAETVSEVSLAPSEPTHNFIVGIVTHPAYESDEAGAAKMEAQQAAMGLDKPPVQYVDGAYISAQELARATAEGRELIGPAPPVPDNNEGRFKTEEFEINVEQRKALCPAGKLNTQCSRLVEKQTGRVTFRFEWSTHCELCPLRQQCVAPKQKHRMIVVGEHHSVLQARRQEQQSEPFKQRMKHRNGIEGTQSELVRGHGLRHARYRGLIKVGLQTHFIGAACNVKRWLRLEAWKLRQALSVGMTEAATDNAG